MIEIRKRHTPKAREDRCSCMASDGLGFWGRESLSVQWDEAVLLLLGLRMKIVGLLAVTLLIGQGCPSGLLRLNAWALFVGSEI